MPIIEARNLTKTFRTLKRQPGFVGAIRTLFSNEYEEVRAVEDVSFAVEPGEVVGYIGPNGAGKSTTLKMLTGILYPSAGTAQVDGLVPYDQRQANGKKIGVLFGQRTQLFWDIPPRDSFDLMRKMYAVPPARYAENLAYFTELLELGPLLDRPVRQLSLGQRMRCELVASLLHDPKILYLDEPTIGLDVVAKERVREFIRSVNSERGTTVILTTHDIGDIEQLCRRVLIIDKGRLLYDGTLNAIKQQYGRLRRVRFSVAAATALDGLDEALSALGADVTLAPGEDAGQFAVSFDPHSVPASAVTKLIVNRLDVADLAVEEADLEGIIRAIYRREEGR